jgi:hypothetical protein
MRRLLALFCGAMLLASAPAPAASRADPETRLARMLKGRVAGEPVDCINLRRIRSSQIIDDTAIVYDAGSILYVNRPRAGRRSLDRSDILVTNLHSSELCSIDVVRLLDSSSRMQTGTVFLGDFVPYSRVRMRP